MYDTVRTNESNLCGPLNGLQPFGKLDAVVGRLWLPEMPLAARGTLLGRTEVHHALVALHRLLASLPSRGLADTLHA